MLVLVALDARLRSDVGNVGCGILWRLRLTGLGKREQNQADRRDQLASRSDSGLWIRSVHEFLQLCEPTQSIDRLNTASLIRYLSFQQGGRKGVGIVPLGTNVALDSSSSGVGSVRSGKGAAVSTKHESPLRAAGGSWCLPPFSGCFFSRSIMLFPDA